MAEVPKDVPFAAVQVEALVRFCSTWFWAVRVLLLLLLAMVESQHQAAPHSVARGVPHSTAQRSVTSRAWQAMD